LPKEREEVTSEKREEVPMTIEQIDAELAEMKKRYEQRKEFRPAMNLYCSLRPKDEQGRQLYILPELRAVEQALALAYRAGAEAEREAIRVVMCYRCAKGVPLGQYYDSQGALQDGHQSPDTGPCHASAIRARKDKP
jgi:hypothetical protein